MSNFFLQKILGLGKWGKIEIQISLQSHCTFKVKILNSLILPAYRGHAVLAGVGSVDPVEVTNLAPLESQQ